MEDQLLVALCDYLTEQIALDLESRGTGCDDSFARTEAWLRARGADVEGSLKWLRRHGARCDCDVVLKLALPRP